MISSERVAILDGGLATELEARGHDLADPLWSARVLLGEPEAIADVHRAYFAAGATIATTASYQATVPGFERVGLDRAAALQAISRAVELARRARDEHATTTGARPGHLLVAGSVGPYGAMLANGSEYRGDYDPGPATLRDVHAPRIEALLEGGVDLLALETIPTVREAEVLVRLVAESGAQAWLSYQCRDGRSTAAGERIDTAVSLVDDVPTIVAVGVNCTAPRHLPGLLAAAASATTRPLIAYPNDGDRWDPAARSWVGSEPEAAFDPVTVAGWTRFGATWLGGCCGTGPTEIGALAAALRRPADGPASAPTER